MPSINVVELPPPHLTPTDLLWRIAVSALISAAAAFIPSSFVAYGIWSTIVTVVLGGVAWVLVFYRRRRPTAVAVLICCCSIGSPLAVGPGVWALFSLATSRRVRRFVIGSAVAVVACGIALSLPVAHPAIRMLRDNYVVMDAKAVFASAGSLLQWVAGLLVLIGACGWQVGSQRKLIWVLHDRARRAEAERDLRMTQARSMERERIAREMHDGLAHRISQISVHAGALAYRPDLDAQRVAAAAETIQQGSHQALKELREVLGVLRDTDDADGSRPVASADDLDELITASRSAGMQITTEVDRSALVDLAPPIGRAVYRIAQEGLTNATRHAYGQPVLLQIDRNEHDLEITVRNPMATGPRPGRAGAPMPESGYGLVGLTERVGLLGGTLHTERTTTDHTLRVRLPLMP